MRIPCILVAVLGSLALYSTAVAQDRDPQTVVELIRSNGHISGLVRDLHFPACPGDAVARHALAVFEVVSEAQLPTRALSQLGLLWHDTYADCDYAPLQRWYERTAVQLLDSDDEAATNDFVGQLPANITTGMRQILFDALDSGVGGELATLAASKAVRAPDWNERMRLTLQAFGERRVSRTWIYSETGLILREAPEEYLRALARESAQLPDERLQIVLEALATHIRAGKVDADAPGLVAVRESVRGRTDVPVELGVRAPGN